MSERLDQAAGFLDIIQNSSCEVWKYFLKNRFTEKARCKTCKIILSNKGPYLLLVRYIVRGTPDESVSNFTNEFA